MNNKLKLFLAIVIAVLFIALAPSIAYRHYVSVYNDMPKLGEYTKFEKMPYNLFDELRAQFPKRPKNYKEVKFKILHEIANYTGQGNIMKAKQAEARLKTDPLLNGRYLDDVITDNWKVKGYIQKTNHYIDSPARSTFDFTFQNRIFSPAYTIVLDKPINLYLDVNKVSLFQSYFYASDNNVFVVDGNGTIYKMPDDLKTEFYNIQLNRENAKNKINFILNNLWHF